ncbi:hypothetical protein, partial [Yersinia intermedia]|uniref:hypothetical protein n=1 Tax=Yersinia intermedia TaxID=631 RepID=UPI000B0F7060
CLAFTLSQCEIAGRSAFLNKNSRNQIFFDTDQDTFRLFSGNVNKSHYQHHVRYLICEFGTNSFYFAAVGGYLRQ